MLNFIIFKDMYFNLEENCRNRVLGNIFNINNVSVSDILIREDKVIFRMFSINVFYQYIFLFCKGENIDACSGKINNHIIYIDNCKKEDFNGFIYQLIRLKDEDQINLFLKNYL